MSLEYCFVCDKLTGNAWIHDGSLYDVDSYGPYCQECWDKLPDDKKEE